MNRPQSLLFEEACLFVALSESIILCLLKAQQAEVFEAGYDLDMREARAIILLAVLLNVRVFPDKTISDGGTSRLRSVYWFRYVVSDSGSEAAFSQAGDDNWPISLQHNI